MRIRKDKYMDSYISLIHATNSILTREDAIRWGIRASHKLPFERKHIRVEDGKSYHDGTISFNCSNIKNEDSFINEYLDSEIGSIIISGKYKGAHISVQVLLNLLRVDIDVKEKDIVYAEEIEQILGLV